VRRGIGPLLIAVAMTSYAAMPAGAEDWPDDARSGRVVGGAALVRATPDEEGELRGAIRYGTRVPLLEHGGPTPRCPGWFRVFDEGWVCEDNLRPSMEEPLAEPQPRVRGTRTLPYRYWRVPDGGAPVFRRPGEPPIARLTADAIIATHRWGRVGDAHSRRLDGTWIRRDALRALRPSRFEGVETDADSLPRLAWNIRHRTALRDRIGGRIVDRLRYHTRVRTGAPPSDAYVELDSGQYVREDALTSFSVAAPPADLASGERWVDVELDSQILVAYEGVTPVFATLVSTGRPWRDRETPRGEFRVWIKMATSTMDQLEDPDATDRYSVEAVPWVQYFEGSNALHAAFWHDSFGARVSHGCINLSPADARRLFDWSEPVLPPGWVTVRPTASQPGTRIRVR